MENIWDRLRLRLGSPFKSRRLDLDVVRGVAILLAMGWHLSGGAAGVPVLETIFWPARTFGWAGVDLFFVLSGFLMGQIVFKERDRTGGFDSKRFLIRRALKLWPIFYLFLFAQLLFGDHPWQTYFFQNFFHLQNYLGSSQDHLWSLAVEEHFYLALALATPFLPRGKSRPRTMAACLGALVVIPLVFRVVGMLGGETATRLQTLTHYRVDGLAAGVLLGFLATSYPSAMERMIRVRAVWLALTLAAVAFVSTVPKGSPLGSTIGYTVTVIGSVSFILLLYRADWIVRVRYILRPVAALGLYSYSLYIWHIAAARLAELIVIKVVHHAIPAPAQMTINYAAAIMVGIGLTLLVEWPFLRLRERLYPAASPSTPQSAAEAGAH